MSDARLKSLAERINRLMDERDAIGGDIRDIFSEAKGVGYVPKVLRKAISRQRMDASKRDEEDSILELYEAALDSKTKAVIAELKAGATFDATSEKTGTPRRTVARIAETVPKVSRNGTDPETGEVTNSRVAEGDEGCVRIGEGTDVAPVDPPGAHPEPEASLAGEADAPAPIRAIDTRPFGEVAGEIPPHLRRAS